jgi:hypothetical protein
MSTSRSIGHTIDVISVLHSLLLSHACSLLVSFELFFLTRFLVLELSSVLLLVEGKLLGRVFGSRRVVFVLYLDHD